jgi:hypothetical protein
MNEIYTILQNFNKVAEPVAEETVTEAVEFDAQDFEYIMDEIKNLTHQALQMLPYEHRAGASGYWYAHINDAVDGRGMLTMQDSLNAASGSDEDEDEAWESIENTAQNLLK